MGVLKARVGGAWVPISQGFSAAQVGYVGHAYGPTSDVAHTSGQPITGMSVTWNAIAGHTYRVIANVSCQPSAISYVDFTIVDAANTSKASKIAHAAIATAYVEVTVVEVFTATVSQSETRKGWLSVSSGTVTLQGAFNRKAIIVVEDITQVQPADGSLFGTEAGTYTPVLTGMAVGGAGAINVASYTFIGAKGSGGKGQMSLSGVVTFGTGATLPTGAIKIGFPAGFVLDAATGGAFGTPIQLTSAGVDVMIGYIHADPGGMNIYSWVGTPAVAPIWPRRGNINANSPFTWKVTDQITWSAVLPMARV